MNQQYREVLINMYLDYLNNYISINRFAEDNGLTADQAKSLVILAREVYNSDHPDA